MSEITIDLDQQGELLDRTLPWEFGIKVGGVRYSTRRPSVAEVGQLTRMEQMTDDQAYALLGGLFDDPRPDLRGWNFEQLQGGIAAYLAYLRVRSSKKAAAIMSTVRAQVAEAEKPRTSSGNL